MSIYGTISYPKYYGKVNNNLITGSVRNNLVYGKVSFPDIVISPYVPPAASYPVCLDTSTVAWYDCVDTTYLVKNSSDYVSALIDKANYTLGTELFSNSGAAGMTDWTDTNADGLADGFNIRTVGVVTTCSIVTGNGFSGNAQRIAYTSGSGYCYFRYGTTNNILDGKKYRISLKTRHQGVIAVFLTGNAIGESIVGTSRQTIVGSIATDTGDAKQLTMDFQNVLGANKWLEFAISTSAGDFFEFDEISVKEITGNHLYQTTISKQPLWSADGVLFDGVNDFMKAFLFTWEQPAFIYVVVEQLFWTLYDCLFDGGSYAVGALFQESTTPSITLNHTCKNNNLFVGQWAILRALFYGANSKAIVDNTTPTTGNPDTVAMGGFTLGACGTGGVYFSNIQVKEIILRNVADTSDDEAAIYDYLKTKYSL